MTEKIDPEITHKIFDKVWVTLAEVKEKENLKFFDHNTIAALSMVISMIYVESGCTNTIKEFATEIAKLVELGVLDYDTLKI